MSPFFSHPAFIAAVHEERARRLAQISNTRHSRTRSDDGRRAR